jgi:hypothetical protein
LTNTRHYKMTGKVDWLVAGHTLSRLTNAKRYKGHRSLARSRFESSQPETPEGGHGGPGQGPPTTLVNVGPGAGR